MKPTDQTTFGDGSDGTPPGNCLAACFSSILEIHLETIPNFAASPRGWSLLQEWLAPQGLWSCRFQCRTLQGEMVAWPNIPDNLHYIALGPGPRGWRHAVVMLCNAEGTRVVHDPHPSRAGLIETDALLFISKLV